MGLIDESGVSIPVPLPVLLMGVSMHSLRIETLYVSTLHEMFQTCSSSCGEICLAMKLLILSLIFLFLLNRFDPCFLLILIRCKHNEGFDGRRTDQRKGSLRSDSLIDWRSVS